MPLLTYVDNKIMIVALTCSREMHVYQATVAGWQSPPEAKQNPQGQHLPVPSIQVSHMKKESLSGLLRLENSRAENAEGLMHLDPSTCHLSHLNVIPPLGGGPTEERRNLIILAAFCQENMNGAQQFVLPPTVIVRWEIESTVQTLHHSFDEMPSKKGGSQPKVRLQPSFSPQDGN